RQRLDFLVSGVFWMDGIFILLMAAGVLALMAAVWTGVAWSVPSPALLVGISLAPVLLVADGVVKTRIALGRVRDVDFRDAVGVMGFWYALKLTNLRASLRAMAGRSMTFQRTPKDSGAPGRASWYSMLRPTLVETVLAVGIAAAASVAAFSAPSNSLWNGFGRVLLVLWLGYYAATFGAAPILNFVAHRPSAPSAMGGRRPGADRRDEPR
ncbi:MAG: hypothetical protein ACYDFT_07790, partial [Thermoplasmata archaeon]